MVRRDDSATLAALEERLRWARGEGSPIAMPDEADDARLILRRWRSAPRRLRHVTPEERARDLVRGFVEWSGGAAMVGPLKADIEWLVEQLLPVLESADV